MNRKRLSVEFCWPYTVGLRWETPVGVIWTVLRKRGVGRLFQGAPLQFALPNQTSDLRRVGMIVIPGYHIKSVCVSKCKYNREYLILLSRWTRIHIVNWNTDIPFFVVQIHGASVSWYGSDHAFFVHQLRVLGTKICSSERQPRFVRNILWEDLGA